MWGPQRSGSMYGFGLFLLDRLASLQHIRSLCINIVGTDPARESGGDRYECAAPLFQRLLLKMTELRELKLVLCMSPSYDGGDRDEVANPYMAPYTSDLLRLILSSVRSSVRELTVWVEDERMGITHIRRRRCRLLRRYVVHCLRRVRGAGRCRF